MAVGHNSARLSLRCSRRGMSRNLVPNSAHQLPNSLERDISNGNVVTDCKDGRNEFGALQLRARCVSSGVPPENVKQWPGGSPEIAGIHKHAIWRNLMRGAEIFAILLMMRRVCAKFDIEVIERSRYRNSCRKMRSKNWSLDVSISGSALVSEAVLKKYISEIAHTVWKAVNNNI